MCIAVNFWLVKEISTLMQVYRCTWERTSTYMCPYLHIFWKVTITTITGWTGAPSGFMQCFVEGGLCSFASSLLLPLLSSLPLLFSYFYLQLILNRRGKNDLEVAILRSIWILLKIHSGTAVRISVCNYFIFLCTFFVTSIEIS